MLKTFGDIVKRVRAVSPFLMLGRKCVRVLEITKDSPLVEMFNLGVNPDRLCMESRDINDFQQRYDKYIRTNKYKLFFLFRHELKKEEYFVVAMYEDSSGICRDEFPLSHKEIFLAEHKPRIVIPIEEM